MGDWLYLRCTWVSSFSCAMWTFSKILPLYIRLIVSRLSMIASELQKKGCLWCNAWQLKVSSYCRFVNKDQLLLTYGGLDASRRSSTVSLQSAQFDVTSPLLSPAVLPSLSETSDMGTPMDTSLNRYTAIVSRETGCSTSPFSLAACSNHSFIHWVVCIGWKSIEPVLETSTHLRARRKLSDAFFESVNDPGCLHHLQPNFWCRHHRASWCRCS